MRTIGDDVRELAHVTRDAANEQLARARDEGEKKLGEAKDQLVQYEEELVRQVRLHPMRSVLISAGVGLALGLVFRR